MKRVIAFSLIIVTLLCLASCTYFSSYKAFMLIRSTKTNHCYLSADSFEGRYVFRVKTTGGESGGITYNASLGEGDVTVSYAYGAGGTALPLFTLKSGESVSDIGGYIEVGKGGTVYIIIETVGKAKDLKVNIDFE